MIFFKVIVVVSIIRKKCVIVIVSIIHFSSIVPSSEYISIENKELLNTTDNTIYYSI